MENILKMLPLALLLIGVTIIIWRGVRQKPHDKGRIKGGGSDFPGRNI